MSTIKGFRVGNSDLQYQDPNLASEFSTSKTYSVGDYCFNDGQLYKCTTAVTTAGSWNSSNWTAAKLADDTSDLKSAFTDCSTELILDISNNLFNQFTVSVGLVWANSNPPGRPVSRNDFVYSTFIPVSSSNTYRFSDSASFVNWYSADNFDAYLRTDITSVMPSGLTPPSNAAFAVLSISAASYDGYYMVQNGADYINYVEKSYSSLSENGLINPGVLASKNSKYETWNNGTHNMSALNDAEDNTTYLIQRTALTQTLNFPADYPADGNFGVLQTFNVNYQLQYTQKVQFLTHIDSLKRWVRTRLSVGTSWSDWELHEPDIPGQINTIYIGSNQQYTTLRAGISAACESSYSIVYVMPGVYDLTQEFAQEIATASAVRTGIDLSNNVHVIFMAGSYVKAIFEDCTEWVQTYFNPFMGRDFILEGLNIEAKNCRYCIHDEWFGSDITYHNVYKNCIMKNISERNNEYTGGMHPQCIGGGLGKHGYIEIIGGIYKSTGDLDASGESPVISYHNGAVEDADSKIYIRDIYCDGARGNIRIGDHGPSTIKSDVTICGCSFGSAIIHRGETSSQTVVNFEITEWGNTIRS